MKTIFTTIGCTGLAATVAIEFDYAKFVGKFWYDGEGFVLSDKDIRRVRKLTCDNPKCDCTLTFVRHDIDETYYLNFNTLLVDLD